jgi:hypothetical protein
MMILPYLDRPCGIHPDKARQLSLEAGGLFCSNRNMRVWIFSLCFLLSACVAEIPVGRQDTCGKDRFAPLIGQGEDVLQRILILDPVHIVRSGQRTTPPPLDKRVNFRISDEGIITRIFCG